MKFTKLAMLILIAGMLISAGGCTPSFVPTIKIASVPKDILAQARRITCYEITNTQHLEIESIQGEIEAYSIKHVLWDPTPTNENALDQLRLNALELGANGIINIRYTKGTPAEILTRNCWSSIKVTGTAVTLKSN